MDNVCSKCGNPLRQISGGLNSKEGSTEVIMISVTGCLNDVCEMYKVEILREEKPLNTFNG